MTREDAIALCERGIKFDSTQEGVGPAWAFLKAGCKFTVGEFCKGATKIYIEHPTFDTFENGTPDTEELFMVYAPFVKTTYTREELIDICERAIVPLEKWSNRDTPEAQHKVGECWRLLKTGATFCMSQDSLTRTDEKTIWIEIGDETFYLPTLLRLEKATGGDWY